MTEQAGERSLLSSSAVMAAGTVVSRLSGFVRGILLAAALGAGLHADVFNIANTVPNMLYILLAGGVINAVLVPQLVRAGRNDPDGGLAYTHRVMTLAGSFLLVVTVLLVVGAPLLMRLFLPDAYYHPAHHDDLAAVLAFARYCLPQVFFYGMFVLVGQVLNARGRFGPMMWAPIANNVVSVAVLVAYLVVFGPDTSSGYTPGRELLLGLGSTAGIVVQLLVLVPYLRAAGVSFRPRFDLRGSGLGHTLRLGVWTLLFVIANQVAYAVVVRLAGDGTVDGGPDGTGYTVYSSTFLVTQLPHSVITVSLATAMLPLLSSYAGGGGLAALGRTVSATLRQAHALIVPAAALLAVTATDAAHVIWGYGAAREQYPLYAPSLALFGIGLVLFTTHYLVLRGFYALERNRQAFLVQCAIAGTNIVAALLLVHGAPPAQTAPRLVVAYACAYAVGAALSFSLLRREVGGLAGAVLVRFFVRLAITVASAAAVGWGARTLLDHAVAGSGRWHAVLVLAVVGVLFGAVYLAVARLLRLQEVADVVGLLTRRFGGRARAAR